MNAGLFIPYATRPLVTFEVCRACYAESHGTLFAPAASCQEHAEQPDERPELPMVAPEAEAA